jgi:Domain of unknown function (DUF4443)
MTQFIFSLLKTGASVFELEVNECSRSNTFYKNLTAMDGRVNSQKKQKYAKFKLDQRQLKNLEALVSPAYRGPRAGFGEAQFLKALIEIGKLGRIGRGRLGKLLDLGSGESRTLIRRLKNAGYIEIDSSGCYLTKSGSRKYDEIKRSIPWSSAVEGSPLGSGMKSHAIVLRKPTGVLRKGIEQRDAAIKAGANGALTVVYRSGKFLLPSENVDCERNGRTEPWNSIRTAALKNGDTVIISSAESALGAEYGALSAALTLL